MLLKTYHLSLVTYMLLPSLLPFTTSPFTPSWCSQHSTCLSIRNDERRALYRDVSNPHTMVRKATKTNTHYIPLPRDPSTFSEGDWGHSYVGLEGPSTF